MQRASAAASTSLISWDWSSKPETAGHPDGKRIGIVHRRRMRQRDRLIHALRTYLGDPQVVCLLRQLLPCLHQRRYQHQQVDAQRQAAEGGRVGASQRGLAGRAGWSRGLPLRQLVDLAPDELHAVFQGVRNDGGLAGHLIKRNAIGQGGSGVVLQGRKAGGVNKPCIQARHVHTTHPELGRPPSIHHQLVQRGHRNLSKLKGRIILLRELLGDDLPREGSGIFLLSGEECSSETALPADTTLIFRANFHKL